MKRVQVGADVFAAPKIVRGDADITGYSLTGDVLFRFRGVNDFAAFTLLDDAVYDEVAGASLAEQLAALASRQEETETALLGLMYMTTGGGS